MLYDHYLAECIREAFAEMGIKFEAKLIIGILCFMVDDRMCVGILDQRLIVRIKPADETAAMAKLGCKPMYFIGRPMKGFMFIDPNGTYSREQLLEWLEFALACNREESAPKRRNVLEKLRVRNGQLPKNSGNAEPGSI